MYLMTSLGDLNKATRNEEGLYEIEVWYREKWTRLGIYSKLQIDNALREGTIQNCTKEKAERFIRINKDIHSVKIVSTG